MKADRDASLVMDALMMAVFGECTVVAVADTADRGFSPGFKQPSRIFYRDILADPVAVMDQPAQPVAQACGLDG
jgi:hypothetical protein